MTIKIDRKVIIHIILIGIILTVVFLITLDLKKVEYNLEEVAPIHKGSDHLLNNLEI